MAGPGQQGIDYYNAVAADSEGNLFVAWTHAERSSIFATVNRVNPNGSLTRIAGNGQPCARTGEFNGRVPALEARLCAVVGLAWDRNGLLNLLEGGRMVLRLTADRALERVAGNAEASSLGDGGPALQASLAGQGWPAIAFDPLGILHVSQPGLNIVRIAST